MGWTLSGVLVGFAVLAMACGGLAPTPTPTPTPTPPFCGLAYLFIDPPTPHYLEITVGGLGFLPDRLEVAASIKEIEPGMTKPLEIREVVLCFSNVSTISQHNWVMVRDGTKDAVIKRGSQHPENGWVQPDDPDVIAHTKLLDPGESGHVRFTPSPVGRYQFVCTFPGQGITMFGDFVVTP